MLNSETVMEVMKSLLNRKTIVDVAIEQNLSVEEVKKCLDQLNDINGSTYHPELYISICEIQQELANEKLEEKRNQEVEKRRQQKELLFLKAQQKREELKRQEEIIEQKKGTLSKISIDVLEEVLLMALTYRTSF